MATSAVKYEQLPNHILSVSSILLCGVLLRLTVAQYSYSGAHKPPMFGDYEAQRHWMEVMTQLPMSQWYTHSADNDLLYWGLDYPPLTAYHSWFMGHIAQRFFNSSWVALNTSRGFESPEHKHFMRTSVLISEAMTFLPAVLYFTLVAYPKDTVMRAPPIACLLVMVLNPSLVLVDHGHFQYNCVSLGLFITAVALFMQSCDILGSVAFCLALGYKQMELYHALPIFFYLLARCYQPAHRIRGLAKLLGLGLATIFTLALVFAPVCLAASDWMQVFRRMFPLNRGLYEDKVGNVWCALSGIVKVARIMSRDSLVLLCAGSTLLVCAPACFCLWCKPTRRALLHALAICALVFFLFSYHVHEKSILLAAVPVSMLYSFMPHEVELFMYAALFSMWPLMVKDGLAWATVLTFVCVRAILSYLQGRKSPLRWFLLTAQLAGYFVLCGASLVFTPPQRYPDLFDLLIAMFSCLQFTLFLGLLYFRLFTVR